MDAKPYRVEIEGFILGTYYKKGGTVPLNERQAKPFLREKRISAPKAAAAKPATPALKESPKSSEPAKAETKSKSSG